MRTGQAEPPASAVAEPVANAADGVAATDALRLHNARRVLASGLLLGVAGDLLLRSGPDGLAFPVWIALAVVSAIIVAKRVRRALSFEASAWLATAFLFSIAIAWRDSETLVFFDYLAVLGAIMLAGVAAARPDMALFAERLRDTVFAVAALARDVVVGVIPLALRDAVDAGTTRRATRTIPTALRVIVISGAMLLVFGALLRSADPIFASLVRLPSIDVGVLVSHVFLVALFTAITAGWARGAFLSRHEPTVARMFLPIRLGPVDVTAALGTLLVLFALFVVAQLGWLFGGEQFLRERTGLTAAAYARQGFFQMAVVVALVVPVLVATRAALDPARGSALRQRHTRLALPIIGLLGVMIVSSVMRTRLYVHYYGLTTDRLYPIVVMGWLAFVLVWLARTVLREWGRPFVAGVVISGLATLGALNVVAPDALVARVNIDRAARPSAPGAQPLDIRYLTTLSGEAAALATRAVLAPEPARAAGDSLADLARYTSRCDAATALLKRWGPAASAARRLEADGAWRTWNADRAAALRAVGENANALLLVQHDACARARAATH
ncbi:MAG TPA: DUF4173 domain-containing protein [Gemmatimonadaceae bacterium]|nr:DUF4173 domain-containing protein [Gemmatimonadaceae bacterium]